MMGSSKVMIILVLALLCMMIQNIGVLAATNSLPQDCAQSIQTLTSCLNYASGKEKIPTKECCTSVSDMKDKKPVCLCFFIGQAHNGSDEIKSLGIQEAKLLQLPSACQLANASVTNCPKLLGISPSSPAAAVFMNSNATSPTPSMSSSSTTTTTTTDDKSSGYKHEYGLLGGLFALFVSTFLFVLPIGTFNVLL